MRLFKFAGKAEKSIRILGGQELDLGPPANSDC
jgi:hypothetical protein